MKNPVRIYYAAALLAVFVIAGRSTDLSAEPPQKLVVVFQKQTDPAKMQSHADAVAAELSKRLNRPTKAVVPSDYSASVQAIVSRNADVAYVDSMSFLLAKRDGGASILLAEERPDGENRKRTDYDSVFVVGRNSSLRSFDDLVKNSKALSIAFTSRTSSSGFLFPYRRFVQSGLIVPRQRIEEAFRTVVFSGSYDLALREVLSGRADVAAVSNYAMEGKKADKYLSLAEREQLRILSRTPGVPTHLVMVRGGLTVSERESIKDAFLGISLDRPDLLADVYGASSFVPVDESHVRATAEAVEYSGISLQPRG